MSAIRKVLGSVVAAGLATVAFAPSALAAGKTGGTTTCTRRCTTDTTPPAVSITTPAAGATVSGSVSVSGSASDNVSVAKVEVQVDGGALQLAMGTSNWTVSIATASYANGSHTIAAKATDTSGNVSTASLTVTVNNSSPDTTPPSVSISAPASGATVSGMFSVAGSAADNVSVARVDVQVDSGPFQTASGTTSWSSSIDTTAYANGSHTLTARATDTAGNATTVSDSVTFATANVTTGSNGDLTWTNMTLLDPAATNALAPLGRGKQAEWGSLSVILYSETFTGRRAAFIRDSASGASSYLPLPIDTANGWSNANYLMSSANDLWIESGDGPVYVRHYVLAGSPLPSSASLASTQTFGDTDSRHGDMTALSSGALVVVWHQQGQTGPQGLSIAYRSPSTSWQVVGPLQFMPTAASKQVVAQHPADGSVWVFNDADAYGQIGAVHLTEGAAGLSLDWTNGALITTTQYGNLGPDPENPDLAVAADPSTSTLALAYEDDHRVMFTSSVTGSYVAVDRIAANGTMSFISLPTYVERTSALGLIVRPGATWLAYRPIDTTTLTSNDLYIDCFSNGVWRTAADLGTFNSMSERMGYGLSRVEISGRMNDGTLHFFTVS